jgi:hypothetical protein
MGPLLRIWYPKSIVVGEDAASIDAVSGDHAAVVYVRLTKPTH